MSRIVQARIAPIPFSGLRLGPRNVRDWMPQRMSGAELVAFVRDLASGKLFVAELIEPVNGDWHLVKSFPAVSFLCDVTEEARRRIGTCYERVENAIGKTPQGYPIFQTVKFIEKEDWHIARDMVAAEMVRRSKAEA